MLVDLNIPFVLHTRCSTRTAPPSQIGRFPDPSYMCCRHGKTSRSGRVSGLLLTQLPSDPATPDVHVWHCPRDLSVQPTTTARREEANFLGSSTVRGGGGLWRSGGALPSRSTATWLTPVPVPLPDAPSAAVRPCQTRPRRRSRCGSPRRRTCRVFFFPR